MVGLPYIVMGHVVLPRIAIVVYGIVIVGFPYIAKGHDTPSVAIAVYGIARVGLPYVVKGHILFAICHDGCGRTRAER